MIPSLPRKSSRYIPGFFERSSGGGKGTKAECVTNKEEGRLRRWGGEESSQSTPHRSRASLKTILDVRIRKVKKCIGSKGTAESTYQSARARHYHELWCKSHASWQLVVAYDRNIGTHCKNQSKLKVAQGRLRGRVGMMSRSTEKPYKPNGKTAFPALLQIQAPVGGCRCPRSWTGNPRRPLEKPW